MGQVAINCYQYFDKYAWVREGAPWQPPDTITLRDEAGVAIGTTAMATMLMTLYNVKTDTIINGVDGTDVKNARGCTISPQGVFVLKLLSADTAIIDSTQPYEMRRALVEFTWPATPTKADSLEITFIVKNIQRLP